MNSVEELQKQHYNNYVEAVKDIVRTNTNSLLENDIYPLFKTPPLDSMDQIKTKFLLTAKREKLIVETENLNKVMDEFRKNIVLKLKKITEVRDKEIIDSFKGYIKEGKNIKITKTEINNIDKKVKKIIKKELDSCIKEYILNNSAKPFIKSEDANIDDATKEIEKYFSIKGIYQKTILENIDFKLLVKNTILINGIKEQTERYMFTLNNSRIFNN